jgi:hypothetical protein
MPDSIDSNKSETKPLKIEDIFDTEQKIEVGQPSPQEQRPEAVKEAAPEVHVERKSDLTPEAEQSRRQYIPPPQPAAPPVAVQKNSEVVKIESILSEHLDDLYLMMTPQQQLAFREKGEETAGKIATLLQGAKVKIREILNLIRDWLKLLPGINKFFLEQEAKIKTDRILNLHEQKYKQK